jgi:hypothetical protein
MLYKKYANGVQQMVVPPGAQPMGGISEMFANNQVGSKKDARAQGVGTGMQFAGAASKIALDPKTLVATGGLSALAVLPAYAAGHAYGAWKGDQLEQIEKQGEDYNTQALVQQEKAGQELGYMNNQMSNTFGGSLHGDMQTETIYAKHGVNMGNMPQDGVYRLTADFANAPTHEQGGQKIVAKLKSGSMVYPKGIEVEKGELQVEDDEGNVAIIPRKKSKEAKEALANGDNLRMKEIIRNLPKETEAPTKGNMLYAQGGLNLGNPLNLPLYNNGMPLVPGSPLAGNVQAPYTFDINNPLGGNVLQPYMAPSGVDAPNYSGQPNYVEPVNPMGTPAELFFEENNPWLRTDPTGTYMRQLYDEWRDRYADDPRRQVSYEDLASYLETLSGEGSTGGMGYGAEDGRNIQGGFMGAWNKAFNTTAPAMDGSAMGAAGTAYLPTPKTFDIPEGVAPVELAKTLPDITPKSGQTPALGGEGGEGWEKFGEIASLVGEAAPSIYNLGMGLFSDVDTEQAATYDPRLEGKDASALDPARARIKGATNLAANQVYGANKAVQAQNAQMAKLRGAEMLAGIDAQQAQMFAGVDARNLDRMSQADLMNLQAREVAKLQTKQAIENRRQYLEKGIEGMAKISGDLRTRGETKDRDDLAFAQQEGMLDVYQTMFPYLARDAFDPVRRKNTSKKTKDQKDGN